MRRNRYRYRRRNRRSVNKLTVLMILAAISVAILSIIIIFGLIKKGRERSVSDNAMDVVELGIVNDYRQGEAGTEEVNIPVPTGADPELLSATSSATSISLEWVDTGLGEYSVLYRPVYNANEMHGKEFREDKSNTMSEICTAVCEGADTGEESEANGWVRKTTSDTRMTISGLDPNTAYHIHVVYTDERIGQYIDTFDVSTEYSGYGDPFKAVDSLMRVSQRDDETGQVISVGETVTVQMTSVNGCQGVVVKPMLETGLYSDVSLQDTGLISTLAKGTRLIITPDEGNNYCYYDGDNGYRLYVMTEDGQSGWIEARRVLIDMNKTFSVDSIYSMQFDRTNAYSSIFTAGGDAMNVELDSEPDSRYNPLLLNGDKAAYMSTTGYNGIDGVTGLELYNYESPDYMPVIWDLALELKQCQKNALENGYTIKMYEGYRPLSTSQLVYNNLANSGSLSLAIGNTNLAQGYITGQSYNVGYYIGQKSRHNRGVATDLTIVRLNSATELGEEAHMQTKMHTLDFRCNMFYNTWEADLLTDIMIGHGSHLEYLTYRQEWWHFQLRNDRKDLYPLVETYGYEDFVF